MQASGRPTHKAWPKGAGNSLGTCKQDRRKRVSLTLLRLCIFIKFFDFILYNLHFGRNWREWVRTDSELCLPCFKSILIAKGTNDGVLHDTDAAPQGSEEEKGNIPILSQNQRKFGCMFSYILNYLRIIDMMGAFMSTESEAKRGKFVY